VGVAAYLIASPLLVINGFITHSGGIGACGCESSLHALMLTQHGRWILLAFSSLVV
jgi:hypothetical protein